MLREALSLRKNRSRSVNANVSARSNASARGGIWVNVNVSGSGSKSASYSAGWSTGLTVSQVARSSTRSSARSSSRGSGRVKERRKVGDVVGGGWCLYTFVISFRGRRDPGGRFGEKALGDGYRLERSRSLYGIGPAMMLCLPLLLPCQLREICPARICVGATTNLGEGLQRSRVVCACGHLQHIRILGSCGHRTFLNRMSVVAAASGFDQIPRICNPALKLVTELAVARLSKARWNLRPHSWSRYLWTPRLALPG